MLTYEKNRTLCNLLPAVVAVGFALVLRAIPAYYEDIPFSKKEEITVAISVYEEPAPAPLPFSEIKNPLLPDPSSPLPAQEAPVPVNLGAPIALKTPSVVQPQMNPMSSLEEFITDKNGQPSIIRLEECPGYAQGSTAGFFAYLIDYKGTVLAAKMLKSSVSPLVNVAAIYSRIGKQYYSEIEPPIPPGQRIWVCEKIAARIPSEKEFLP